MTNTEERRVVEDYRQRLNFINDLCASAEAGQLGQFGAWRPGRKIFDVLDYEKLAKCAGEAPITVFDAEVLPKGVKLTGPFKEFNGPVLTQAEISKAVIRAVNEKEPERKKGGLKTELVTTKHILFQFYLIKAALRQAAI